jgi:hypothetical protein
MSFSWPNASVREIVIRQCISLLLDYDQRLIDFIFDPARPRIRKRAAILIEDAWAFSHGEQLLIRAALDLWSGSGHLQLWEMLETWDDASWARFVRAIAEYRRLDEVIGEHEAESDEAKPLC